MDHAIKVNSETELKMGSEHTHGPIILHILGILNRMNLKGKAYSNGVTGINTKECGERI